MGKFKIFFLMFMLLLIHVTVSHAAASDLISEQVTVRLDQAGSLKDKIGSSKKYKISNLKIIGKINGTDIDYIRDMAGLGYWHTKGSLSILDLSEATIVKGDAYHNYKNNTTYWTSDNCLGDYTFANCSGLTSITIPSSVTSIGAYAFGNCSGLTSIVIPSSVTSIDSGAFQNCSGLTSVSIPSSVTSIPQGCFDGCSGLTSLTIPSSVTSIGDTAFCLCSGLTSITIPSSVTSIEYQCFSGCSGLTNMTIPSSVTYIGTYAFKDCFGITNLTIPSSVVFIGLGAFERCRSLTNIYVYAKTVPKMEYSVFKDCDSTACKVFVPKGTYEDYWLSEFGYFNNIVEFEPSDINNKTHSTNAREVSRYSMNGQKLSEPTKGLNIVKYSDGRTRKIATH